MSVTMPSSARRLSCSENSAICWRNSSTLGSSAVAWYSRETPISSSRFSIRPSASIVRSARNLDLGSVVELGAADDLVADAVAHQRVLQDPRLRVGAVEDRNIVARHAFVHQTLDLSRHVTRFTVLDLELADDR